MPKQIWLAKLCRQLAPCDSRVARRRVAAPQSAMIELLESRQLLSAAPMLTAVSPTATFVSPGPAQAISPNIVVTQPDGLKIQSATVTFSGWQPEDRLAFFNSQSLQHSFTQDFSTNTATLTIMGAATAAAYQTLLRSVTYQDVAGNPNTAPARIATIGVNDGSQNVTAATSIGVVRYLTGATPVVGFIQGAGPVALAPNLVVTAPVGVNVQNATVTFTNWQGEDRLAFNNSVGLQHSFVQNLAARTATLTMTGAASGTAYQTLLRSVTYQDVAGNPITTTRGVKISLNDGKTTVSVAENVTVTKAMQPPLVQINDSASLSVRANAAPLDIFSQALITDPDSMNLSSLTVKISAGYYATHDILTFKTQFGISGSFNSTTGILTLTGESYVGHYREALRSVTFRTIGTGVSIAPRTLTVVATDTSNRSSIPVSLDLSVSN
ncbi:hypothetical protein [Schlesneria paludicola]|uniref:hypothetical protein n=1 Tax=Schlesneria paludicola TaxID=360056 RepID=UPI00029B327A|nr:hypothetical protein [Schlesneria paludicola]